MRQPGRGWGIFDTSAPAASQGRKGPGSCPAFGGREACRGRSPAGSSGRVGEKRVPASPPSPRPLPLSVPPGPHRVSAARTGPPPSGSPRAQSLTQHDGLGAAAARSAVPAGAARPSGPHCGTRTGPGARGSRGPARTATAGFSSRLWPEPGLQRPRTGVAALAPGRGGAGIGSGDPRGGEGSKGATGWSVRQLGRGLRRRLAGGWDYARVRAWGERESLAASPATRLGPRSPIRPPEFERPQRLQGRRGRTLAV